MSMDRDTRPACVADFVAATALADPERVAFEAGDQTVTYRELHDTSSHVADWLVTRLGTEPRLVGVCCVDPYSFVLAGVALARAGMVCASLTPSYPPERLDDIAAELQVALVLTDAEPSWLCTVVDSVPITTCLNDSVAAGAHRRATPGAVQSIVYTSGSSGEPKAITHLRRHRVAAARFLGSDERVRVTGARFGYIFNGSLPSLEATNDLALSTGGTLVPYDFRSAGLHGLRDWFATARPTFFTTVPTVLRHLLPLLDPGAALDSLDTVLTFGEALLWSDVRALRPHLRTDAMLIVLFGSMETGTTAWYGVGPGSLLGEGAVPVAYTGADGPGGVMPGREILVVDEAGVPVPQGDSGEIVVSADYADACYWGRPDLSAQRWRPLPDGSWRCHTGDRGYVSVDRTLRLQGRFDSMVKISGNRVDLADLEARLTDLSGIGAAAVSVYEDNSDNKRLTAFVVPTVDPPPTVGAVRRALARQLPSYSLPDFLFAVAEFPRLPNGKVDRRTLSASVEDKLRTGVAVAHGSARPADSSTEASVAQLFEEILGVADVAATDDFFDLGGDSVRGARLMAELQERTGRALPVALLLERSTPARLAELLGAQSLDTCLVPVRPTGHRPPLFVFHDVQGNVLFARKLAELLGPEQPVHVLRAPQDRTSVSLEALAARYLREILLLRPHGPYVFFGHSFGGIAGYEAARQLIARGAEDVLVVMGDTPAPKAAHQARATGLRGVAVKGRLRWRKMTEGPLVPALADAMLVPARHTRLGLQAAGDAARRIAGRQPPMAPQDELAGYLTGITGSYDPPATPVSTVLIRGAWSRYDKLDRDALPFDLGWSEQVGSRLRVSEIGSDHHDLLDETRLPQVADILRAEMDHWLPGTGSAVDGRVDAP